MPRLSAIGIDCTAGLPAFGTSATWLVGHLAGADQAVVAVAGAGTSVPFVLTVTACAGS